MKKRHSRTVEIVTFTVTCDVCGCVTLPCGRDALRSAGWVLGESQDVCPDCARGIAEESERRAAEKATARYIEALERGDVPLIHGRIYND